MQLKRKLTGEISLALGRTAAARGVSAVGSLVLGVIIGRLYGTAGLGVFALAETICFGCGLLAQYGMNNTLVRYVGQAPYGGHLLTYLRRACRKARLLSLPIAISVGLARDLIAVAFNDSALASVLVGIAFAIPAFTLAFVLAGFLKGVRKPATATLLENGSISLVAAAILLTSHQLTEGSGIAFAGL